LTEDIAYEAFPTEEGFAFNENSSIMGAWFRRVRRDGCFAIAVDIV
jgi:hypothetical protein